MKSLTHMSSLRTSLLLAAAAVGLSAAAAKAEPAAAPAPRAAAVEAAAPDQQAQPAADAAPAAAEPVAEAAPTPAATAPAVTVSAKDMPVGTAVFGTDGTKIGEINRVTSEPDGAVTEIHVTTGGAAGLNAKVFSVSADKIAGIKDGVKLSLSAQEAKSLPVLDNGNG